MLLGEQWYNFKARILEWVAVSFSRYLPDPGIKRVSCVSCILY